MHFSTLANVAVLAVSTSAAVLPRGLELPGPFSVNDFGASHEPHGSYADVSFYLSNPDPKINLTSTECVAQSITATTNLIGQFATVNQCADKQAGFVFSQNTSGDYVLEVFWGSYATGTYEGSLVFPKANITFFESPAGSGEKWQTIDAQPHYDVSVTSTTNGL